MRSGACEGHPPRVTLYSGPCATKNVTPPSPEKRAPLPARNVHFGLEQGCGAGGRARNRIRKKPRNGNMKGRKAVVDDERRCFQKILLEVLSHNPVKSRPPP